MSVSLIHNNTAKLTEFFLQAWKHDRRGKGPIDSVKRVSGFRLRHEPLRHDGQDDGGGDQLDPDHGGPGHHHEPGGAEVVEDSLQRRDQGKPNCQRERWTPWMDAAVTCIGKDVKERLHLIWSLGNTHQHQHGPLCPDVSGCIGVSLRLVNWRASAVAVLWTSLCGPLYVRPRASHRPWPWTSKPLFEPASKLLDQN